LLEKPPPRFRASDLIFLRKRLNVRRCLRKKHYPSDHSNDEDENEDGVEEDDADVEDYHPGSDGDDGDEGDD